jgi:hypothetical protein
MYLRLGQVDTVVVSSPEAAQEVLRANDISFASRPSLLATDIICYGSLDLAFVPYGDYWRALCWSRRWPSSSCCCWNAGERRSAITGHARDELENGHHMLLRNRTTFWGCFIAFIQCRIHGPEAVPRHHTIAARSGSCATPSDMHGEHAVAVTTHPTCAATPRTGHISVQGRGSMR